MPFDDIFGSNRGSAAPWRARNRYSLLTRLRLGDDGLEDERFIFGALDFKGTGAIVVKILGAYHDFAAAATALFGRSAYFMVDLDSFCPTIFLLSGLVESEHVCSDLELSELTPETLNAAWEAVFQTVGSSV